MFTGIVQAVAPVRSFSNGVLTLEFVELPGEAVAIGESIAVNGCCLTLVDGSAGLQFDLSPETLSRTSLGDLMPGAAVNLERAMVASGRFGGHFVQGHVDGRAELVGVRPESGSTVFTFRIPAQYAPFVIDKGSVCLDGISLTAVTPSSSAGGAEFDVWVIPHTMSATNLGQRTVGDRLNLEVDVLARYVARLMQIQAPA